MQACGQLTPALLLRALLSGTIELFETALGCLSGLPPIRVRSLLRERGGAGFNALYRKAGMPLSLEKAFRVAVSGLLASRSQPQPSPRLSRPIIGQVLLACAREDTAETGRVMALLGRFDAEAAREDARRLTAEIMAAPKLAQVDLDTPTAPALLLEQASFEADLSDVVPGHALDDTDELASVDLAAIETELFRFTGAIAAHFPADGAGHAEADADAEVVTSSHAKVSSANPVVAGIGEPDRRLAA